MVRRVIIVVLSIGAVATAVFWVWCLADDLNPQGQGVSGHVGLGVYVTHKQDAGHFTLGFGGYPQPGWDGRGGTFGPVRIAYGQGCFVFGCQFWFAVLVLATYPAIAFIRGPLWRWRRRRRRRRGQCLACGYDLTGNLSGLCPECGVPIERRSSA